MAWIVTYGRLPDGALDLRVGLMCGVRVDDRQLLLERLRDEKAVERVAVAERERGDTGGVPEVDGQRLEAVGRDLLGKKPLQRGLDAQAAQADLDRDLPGRGDAHEALVAPGADGGAGPARALAVGPDHGPSPPGHSR